MTQWNYRPGRLTALEMPEDEMPPCRAMFASVTMILLCQNGQDNPVVPRPRRVEDACRDLLPSRCFPGLRLNAIFVIPLRQLRPLLRARREPGGRPARTPS